MIRKEVLISTGLTCSEIALEVCSGGGGSDAAVPLALSARKGTRLEYLSMYASRVSVMGCMPEPRSDDRNQENKKKQSVSQSVSQSVTEEQVQKKAINK